MTAQIFPSSSKDGVVRKMWPPSALILFHISGMLVLVYSFRNLLSAFKFNTKQKNKKRRMRSASPVPQLEQHLHALPSQGYSDFAAITLHPLLGRPSPSHSWAPCLQRRASRTHANTLRDLPQLQLHSRDSLERETHKPGLSHVSCPDMLICIAKLLFTRAAHPA